MSITLNFELNDHDLAHFKTAAERSRKAAEGKSEQEIVDSAVGLLADAASEILHVRGASLAQAETGWGRAYVQGVSPDGLIVISGEALLGDPRLTIDPTQDSRAAS